MARKSTKKQIDDRIKKLRDTLWPEANELVWDYKKSDGWLNIPRSMPIIMRAMDVITKGQPVSSTYLELWCRTYSHGFVTASQTREMAFFSGFDGERAIRTWTSRIRKLEELGFIKTKDGPSGPISYIIIINPYRSLNKLHNDGLIQERYWNAIIERMISIGAKDLEFLE